MGITNLKFIFCALILIPAALKSQIRGTQISQINGNGKSFQLHKTDMNKRMALVIGNSNYAAGALKNATHDAEAMRDVLTENGFMVIYKKDLLSGDIDSAIYQFGNAIINDTGVHLFYYSGHGLQYNGENFMLSTDASLESQPDMDKAGTKINKVIEQMQKSKGGYNLLLLDACRSIPFVENSGLAQGLRDIDDAPLNTSVFYAAKPNHVAFDGSGDHSPFTQALLKHIKQDSLEFYEIARRVTRDVVETTGNAQCPIVLGMALESFYFKNKLERRPTLHLFSIGISEYPKMDVSYSLMYGAKAASDFENIITEIASKDSQYAKINATTLMNGGASKDAILSSIIDLKSSVKEGDVLLFYLSGYLISESGETYFLPSEGRADFVFMDGIPTRTLFSALTSLPCKSMVFMDRAGDPMINDGLGVEIARLTDPTNNVIVLSSNMDFQMPLESVEWGTSLFLHGIKESIANQLDETGSIHIETLCDETRHLVNKISQGKQTPVVYLPQGYLNFELFKSSARFKRVPSESIIPEIPER